MIIYNVTVKIDTDIHDEWLHWMQTKHIPDVILTGYFSEHHLARLMYQDDADGVTYVIQYRCTDIQKLNKYFSEAAPTLQKEHTERYQGKFVAFRTIMELLT